MPRIITKEKKEMPSLPERRQTMERKRELRERARKKARGG
jgi:hypothetical protein